MSNILIFSGTFGMAKKIADKNNPPELTKPLADVFISYSRLDENIARNLSELLKSEGFEVWFDEKIYGGAAWENLLMTTLASAKAVVVLWSKNSVERPWVIKEAQLAARTKKLIPVVLDDCIFPVQFQTIQAVLMPGWKGKGPHLKLEQLLTGIAKLAPPSRIDNVRPGFVTDFLGIDTGLPSITGVADEFKYLHFSVIMNPARRLPWYVAYNMAPKQNVPRGNIWMADPILPAAFQPTNEHFFNTGFDRGHLVSPSIVSWGTPREAELANRQSFFWTNTSPQHPYMNQGWWLQVETWEKDLVSIHKKATGFAGPVFKPDDRLLNNVEQTIGRLTLKQNFRLPGSFWKVVLVKKAKHLYAAAFLIDQEALLKKHSPRNTAITEFQSTITDIEKVTGLGFDENVHKARLLEL